jgi:methylthioribose-1-phosphate isomerase
LSTFDFLMLIQGKQYQSLWWNAEQNCVSVIDQRVLPHTFSILDLKSSDEVCLAIKNMTVRGAPLIGVTAAYGFYFATLEASENSFDVELKAAYEKLLSARPTAVNLKWALDEMMKDIGGEKNIEFIRERSFAKAEEIRASDIETCRRIGEHGVNLIEKISRKKKGAALNILTHCNAGWLACVEWGTATSAIYRAQAKGIDLRVWVDETRPRNQGASLTAFELGEQKIPYTLITDNAGGHLMQQGKVDLVIVGADRIAANGDAANKIGTYLKALAAKDNGIPFYIAAPFSTFDFSLLSGKEIEIEERSSDEVRYVQGKYKEEVVSVLISPENANAANFGFDVTPARLITAFITDSGIFLPGELEESIKA